MERYRTKKGFTLIEVMISGVILVIVMALIAIFFSKAQKIRVAVMKENNTQVIANGQMMNAAIFGIKQPADGLMYATRIEAIDTTNGDSPLWIVFANHSVTTNNFVRVDISTENSVVTDTTLWQKTAPISGGYPPSSWPTSKNLDPNDKINIESGSWFGCYDSRDRNVRTTGLYANTDLERAAISKIEICLVVRDKLLQQSPAFILRNIVTLSNIYHID